MAFIYFIASFITTLVFLRLDPGWSRSFLLCPDCKIRIYSNLLGLCIDIFTWALIRVLISQCRAAHHWGSVHMDMWDKGSHIFRLMKTQPVMRNGSRDSDEALGLVLLLESLSSSSSSSTHIVSCCIHPKLSKWASELMASSRETCMFVLSWLHNLAR